MSDNSPATIHSLTDIVARLRDPENGCPWDLHQDFSSIARYTVEEAYEVADAIERDDMIALKEELGDLLLQVVFHSQMAAEQGAFTLNDVIAGISDKMVRRHPHVFGDTVVNDVNDVVTDWEHIKAQERAGQPDVSALAGVALALPALLRAQKIQKRAARTGFDWPDISGANAKIFEELEEVEAAVSATERTEEIGDLLFAVVNMCRFLDVDAESALKAGTSKFETRFRSMEMAAGQIFPALSLSEKEAHWDQVKAAEIP